MILQPTTATRQRAIRHRHPLLYEPASVTDSAVTCRSGRRPATVAAAAVVQHSRTTATATRILHSIQPLTRHRTTTTRRNHRTTEFTIRSNNNNSSNSTILMIINRTHRQLRTAPCRYQHHCKHHRPWPLRIRTARTLGILRSNARRILRHNNSTTRNNNNSSNTTTTINRSNNTNTSIRPCMLAYHHQDPNTLPVLFLRMRIMCSSTSSSSSTNPRLA